MDRTSKIIFSAIIILFFYSCNADLETVDFGNDKCEFCNMTIIDERYAAALLTSNGNTFKFDDLKCMMEYSNKLVADINEYYIAIYDRPLEPMVRCEEVYFLKNEIFPSPKNSGYVAFIDESKAKGIADSLDTKVIRWKDIIEMEWEAKP